MNILPEHLSTLRLHELLALRDLAHLTEHVILSLDLQETLANVHSSQQPRLEQC